MAAHTMRVHRKRVVQPEPTFDAPTSENGRSWRWPVVLAMLAAVLWLLPSIVAHTPLLQWGVGMATAKLNGSITVESASLGWFSSVAVQGVEVKDPEGKPVLTLAAAQGDRSLMGLLWDYSNLGRLRLESPKLSLVLRDDGSNLEDLLAEYLAPTEESSADVGLSLEIVDGGLSVTDQPTGRSWQVQNLAANIEMPEGPDGPLTASVSADLADTRRPGKLTGGLKMATGGGEATLSTTSLPLAMFRALAARFAPGTTCDGWLSSDLKASWDGNQGGKNRVQADLSADEFAMTTPELQTDTVRFQRLRAVCQASWQADRLEIEKSSVDCDLGNVTLTGSASLGEENGFSLDSLSHQPCELSGRIDLAQLARLLPATLRLRQHVEINSGQLQLALSSRPVVSVEGPPEQPGMKWHGQLDASNLTAVASGRQITWQQPVSLVFDAHESSGEPVIDTLRCESDFLKIYAAGTLDALAASLSFNLKRLSDQLGQFVDLGTIQLAGEGWGNLNWKRSPDQQFNADAEIRLQDFQLALPNRPPWRENDLVALLAAGGQTDFGAQTRIDTATVNLKAGTDQLEARLTGPVADLRDGGTWPVHVRSQGRLENWPVRLAVWLPTEDYQFTGNYTLEADGTASRQRVELRQVTLDSAPLIASLPWLNVNEPQFRVTATGSWDQRQRCLRIDPASLGCATAAIRANSVVLALPEKGPVELAGTLNYQGDVARIRQWFSDPAKPSTWQLAGQLKGVAQLHQAAGVIRGETTTDITNLAVVDSAGQQFQEPRVRLTARGDYASQTGVVQLEKFELTSDALRANANGRIAPVSGMNEAQIDGQIGYDLERVAGLLRPYIGTNVRIVGRDSSPAWYRGPFELATGSGTAGLRWDWADMYGFRLGPGELKATMADGMARIEPLDLAASQGRMYLAPTVRLTPEPIELTLPKGPLARQIQIDPRMCASLLKYIAPVVADVATAQGAFSIDLDGCRIPLSDPATGELAGRFTVHSVEVGPGPLIRAMAVFLGREKPAKLRRESVIPFRMVDGRVYHQDLELMFPEFTIRTYGSVGLDQTLAIMAEMPVPPKWVEQNPMLSQAMRNQTIRVPIGGTLSKPQLDQKVVENLSRQFLQRAAENVLEGELNRQLDRLFGPGK